MSNLENLVKKILDDSKEKASVITEEANKVRDEILDHKTREANENKKRLLEKASRDAELAKERVISGAELRARNEKLMAKQEVIERVFNLAGESLKALDEERYMTFLTKTLEGLNLSGQETLVLTESMKSKVKDTNLRLADDEFAVSGFLIKDKGITLNYTFDSLLEHYREELETQVAEELFKE